MLDFSLISDSPVKVAALFCCAILIGMSKTGLQGINTISIPFLALALGAKESTGVILPMLCFADLIAVFYYRRSAEWKYVAKLLPSALAGFGLAILVDSFIPPAEFKRLMALCIFSGLIVMYWSRNKSETQKARVFNAWWYSPLFGLLGGFTTMIGNAAGPVMAVYMLSMNLPKLSFVGTSAWFFMIVNYLKIPVQILAWNNIHWQSLSINIIAIPFIFLGAFFGVTFVKKVPERAYRGFVVALTIISTLLLLF